MDKFKIGDKVRVKNNCRYKHMIGMIGEVTDFSVSLSVEVKFKNWGKGHGEDNNNWIINNDELELVEKLTKGKLLDMPVGTKITTDAEDEDYRLWIKIEDSTFILSNDDCCTIDDYEINKDLTLDADEDYGTKIIKVEEPRYTEIYADETKEMTIAEIEKKLGYSIKVVKEEN